MEDLRDAIGKALVERLKPQAKKTNELAVTPLLIEELMLTAARAIKLGFRADYLSEIFRAIADVIDLVSDELKRRG